MVIVIAGKDRGQKAKVIRAFPQESCVIVEGVNVVKKHQRRTANNRKGQIIERAMPLHVSNVMIVDPKLGTPSRISITRTKTGVRERVSTKSGQSLK